MKRLAAMHLTPSVRSMRRPVLVLHLVIALLATSVSILFIAQLIEGIGGGLFSYTRKLFYPGDGLALGLCSFPVVYLSLRRKRVLWIHGIVFVPFLVVGTFILNPLEVEFLLAPCMVVSFAHLMVPFVLLWILCLVAAVLAPDDGPIDRRGRCRGCRYNLRGNVSGTCPECGRALQAPVEFEFFPRLPEKARQLAWWTAGMVPTLIFYGLWYRHYLIFIEPWRR